MDIITIFVLNTDGSLKNQRVGNIDSLMLAVDIEGLDFTLTQPPNYEQSWYWYNNQWKDKPSN